MGYPLSAIGNSGEWHVSTRPYFA